MNKNDNHWMEKYGAFLGWVVLAMIGFSFLTVVSRNLFNVVWIPIQELAIYCHALSLMMGMVYAWHHDSHVRVDVFYQRYAQTKKQKINLIGALFLLLPMMGFIIWSCWHYVIDAWLRLEGSAETGGLPTVFVFKSMLLLMPISMALYVIMALFKQFRQRGSN